MLDDSTIGGETRAAIIDGAAAGLTAEALDTSGFVLATLQVAVWALCQPGTLEEVLVEIVNLGGDADPTGAVAGGLLGARHGGAPTPNRWSSRLEYRFRILNAVPSLLELRGPAERPTGTGRGMLADVAADLRISMGHLRRAARDRELDEGRHGQRLTIKNDQLAEWVERRRLEPPLTPSPLVSWHE